jgi:glycosyltransferase involved in cell wall biosynthesis
MALVTIGIPTYNRSRFLIHALTSAVEQDWPELEVIVSDNASSDDTRAVCEPFLARYPFVRYTRHVSNIGAFRNFASVRERARGEYFMWLSDDDWLDRNYLPRCVELLARSPEHVLVAGVAEYTREDGTTFRADAVTLEADDPTARVLAYYRAVADNGTFYGLARAADWRRIADRNTLGADWLMLAAASFLGKIRTVPETAIHRRLIWNPKRMKDIAAAVSVSLDSASQFYFGIGLRAALDVWRSPVYQSLGLVARGELAASVAAIVWQRYGALHGEAARLARRLVAWRSHAR